MQLILISALDKNRAIGKNNQLLWHLPKDFEHFKNKTNGHCILMGRKTFESLPKVLPNRTHLIISRQKDYPVPKGCFLFHSIQEAINFCIEQERVYVIGGAEIYNQCLPFADLLEITWVETIVSDADAFFPEINSSTWQCICKETFLADKKNKFDMQFVTYQKK